MALKNNTELATQVTNDLPDNTAGLITPSKLRGIVASLVESLFNKKADPLTLSVDSIASLRSAIIPDGVKNVSLLGYYNPDDGGGSSFWIDRADTTTADDGGMCIVTNAGLRIKRIVQNAINPQFFGAKGDGVGDDTIPVQKAINAAIALKKELLFPGGIYSITSTILVRAVGLRFAGLTSTKTVFRWSGTTATSALFLIENSTHCHFEFFSIEFSTDLEVGIRLTNNPAFAGTQISSQNYFAHLVIGEVSRGNNRNLSYGIQITGDPAKNSVDTNNDLHRFHNLAVNSYREAAFHMEFCTQAHDLLFHGCSASGNVSNGKYIVKHGAGFFTWINGSGGYSKVSDFLIGATSAPILILKWNSENSKKLLLRTETSNAIQAIRIEGVRFDTSTPTDDYYIQWNGLAAMTVEGCSINFFDTTFTPKISIFNFDTNTEKQKGALIHTNNSYRGSTAGVLNRIDTFGGATTVVSYNNFNSIPEQERLNEVINVQTLNTSVAKIGDATLAKVSLEKNDILPAVRPNTLEYDGVRLFFCSSDASGRKKRQLVSLQDLPVALPPGTATTLSYSSIGDTNGLIYWLGTAGKTTAFSNPVTSGLIAASTDGSSTTLANAFDRQPSDVVISSGGLLYLQIDLGANRLFSPNFYTIINPQGQSHQLRSWAFQGSVNGTDFVDLSIHWDDQISLSRYALSAGFSVTPIGQFFRYFRILLLNVTGDASFIMCIDDLELYGTLIVA